MFTKVCLLLFSPMKILYFGAAIGMLLMSACTSDATQNQAATNNGGQEEAESVNYYALSQFFDDQWAMLKESPYVLLKTITVNDKTDSSFVSLDEAAFKEIRAHFDPNDISGSAFKNLYYIEENYNPDEDMYFINYTAKRDDLLTQKQTIVVNDEDLRIMSIYIESHKSNLLRSESIKLNYNPEKSIVIQEWSKRIFSKPQTTVTKYFFNY